MIMSLGQVGTKGSYPKLPLFQVVELLQVGTISFLQALAHPPSEETVVLLIVNLPVLR